jgi:hypothetical protein
MNINWYFAPFSTGTIRHAGNTDEFQLIRESYNLLDITPETPVFV